MPVDNVNLVKVPWQGRSWSLISCKNLLEKYIINHRTAKSYGKIHYDQRTARGLQVKAVNRFLRVWAKNL